MDHDQLEDERAELIAGEIGGTVLDLIARNIEINKDNIVGFLEAKRRYADNEIHKEYLGNAVVMVRNGK